MTALADAHRQWHQIFGKYTVCDLDCGASEGLIVAFEDDYQALQEPGAHRIKCGSCKQNHASTAAVKLCYEVKRDGEKRNLADSYA